MVQLFSCVYLTDISTNKQNKVNDHSMNVGTMLHVETINYFPKYQTTTDAALARS